MALIDDHGRLFGRVNLIDAMVGLFVLVLVPLGYGAFMLFRTPVPTITAITPAQIPEKQTATVEIVGADLRPFLQAHIGRFAAAAFLVQSPTKAEIKIPDAIPAGTYDLILSDEAQELVRKPGAISIVAPVQAAVTAQVQLLGEFVALSPDLAKAVRVGAVLKGQPPEVAAEVLAVRPSQPGFRSLNVAPEQVALVPAPGQVRVPAIIRVACVVVDNRCTVGGTPAAPDSTVVFALALENGQSAAPASSIAFHVTAVRSTDAPAAFATATIRVRFVARPEVVQGLKPGDVDIAAAGAIGDAELALLTGVESDRQPVTATANVTVAPGQTYLVPQQAVAFVGAVRVPVVATISGWQYKNKAVRIGAPFTFETATAYAQGWIAEMSGAPLPRAAAR
jgi:hypothetical protein